MKKILILGVLALCFAFAFSVSAATPTDLAAWWRFEDDATDSSVNSNHGTLMNDATFGTGKIGHALKLDGINGYVDIPENAGLDISKITIEMWLYPEMASSDGTAKHVIDKRVAGAWTGEYTAYIRGNGDIDVSVKTMTGSAFFNGIAGLIKMNEWSHLAFTWDGAVLKVYLNGGVIGDIDATDGDIANNNESIKIGARADLGSPHFFKGLIDEVRIWKVALTADDLKYEMSGGLDYCPGTGTDVPSVALGTNRWIWNGSVWETVRPKGTGPTFTPDFTYTHGCSCTQILDSMKATTGFDFGGHYKYGCSKSILEDWHVGEYYMGLKWLETVIVPANDADGVMSATTLALGTDYVLKASGTALACQEGQQAGVCPITFDADYSKIASSDTWVDGVAPPYDLYGTDLLDLMVNGGFVDWGAYNTLHEYQYNMAGTGANVALGINDLAGSYFNNTGSLSVDIWYHHWVDLW